MGVHERYVATHPNSGTWLPCFMDLMTNDMLFIVSLDGGDGVRSAGLLRDNDLPGFAEFYRCRRIVRHRLLQAVDENEVSCGLADPENGRECDVDRLRYCVV